MFRILLFTFMLFQFSFTAQPNTDLLDKVVKEQQDIEYQKAVNYIKANYSEFAEMTTNEEKLAKAIKLYRESRIDRTGLVLLFLFNIALATPLALMLFPRVRGKVLDYYDDLSMEAQGIAIMLVFAFVIIFFITIHPLANWVYWSLI